MASSEVINAKLNTVPKDAIVELAGKQGVSPRGTHGDIARRLLDADPAEIDAFIRQRYRLKVERRRQEVISDEELLVELAKVESWGWGVEQGQLDGKIQREYVRKYARYDDLINGVKGGLHDSVTQYAITAWYNYWTTELIEDHISQHPSVVPTIRHVKGVDVFLQDHPFDLKTTFLPKNYALEDALNDPSGLARWLYEHQGEQRFGDDNRFYVVLINTSDVAQSWKLKRAMDIVGPRIDAFLDSVAVSEDDVLPFLFKGRSYTAKCKILTITADL